MTTRQPSPAVEDADTNGRKRDAAKAISAAAGEAVAVLLAEPLDAGLYLIATPIGNLGDITLRALSILARADVVYCEDTRHSRTLLSRYRIVPTLRPYHEHNAESERPRILAALAAGRTIALISDAGTPLLSDPGYKLVRDAIEVGRHVESIPGPSASIVALTASGLPTDAFLFAGFLPPRQAARRTRIEELRQVPATLVFFEAPSRVADTVADLAAVLGSRPAAIARELTKLHEEIVRGTLPELAGTAPAREMRGEIAIVVGPPQQAAVTDDEIADQLENALAAMSLRDAAKAVADKLQLPKSRVYDIGLRLKAGGR